ncbi:MAG: alpha/beta hydrolase family protein [Rhodospirillaceae bacterium]|nr:alpha/beta hydrolase family protein [Rhodospirillaceae bacterium]
MVARRTLLATMPLAAGVAVPVARAEDRFTFVLIHGAWHGGWCWRPVRRLLQAAGHEVFAPTLTGLGERVHLRSPSINVETHVQDIANLIEWEELARVVLVGHSYGGVIVSGVCDRMKDRVAHAVYLDAIVPRDGDTVLPGGTAEAARARFGELQDGYLAAPPDPKGFGIGADMAAERAWVLRRLTPHLLGTWTQPVRLPNGGSDGVPRTFIYCSDKPGASAEAERARLARFRDDPTWTYRELPCGHNSMVILPRETADLFVEAARES